MKNSFLIKSIERKKYKSISLGIIIAILTFVVIGGSLFLLVLGNGLKGMEKRLGADVMVVPQDCSDTAQSVLMEGSREYFYFDRSVADHLRKIDGISDLTEQFYLTSLSSDCCSGQLEIVGFDPETDFIIKPWIEKQYEGKIEKGKAIVGSDVNLEKDKTIKIYGRSYPVISRLAATGTSMDTSVYFTMDTVSQLKEDAQKKGLNFLSSQQGENVISSVFIKLKKGVTQREVAREISAVEETKVDIVYPSDILHSISDNTGHLLSVTYIILTGVWVVVEFILVLACHVSSSGRRKEYALLRVMGLSKNQLIKMILKEILLITFAGFIVGGFLAGITVFPFGRYLANALKIAYLAPSVLETIFIFLTGLVASVLSAMVASVLPVIRICKLDVYAALREEE